LGLVLAQRTAFSFSTASAFPFAFRLISSSSVSFLEKSPFRFFNCASYCDAILEAFFLNSTSYKERIGSGLRLRVGVRVGLRLLCSFPSGTLHDETSPLNMLPSVCFPSPFAISNHGLAQAQEKGWCWESVPGLSSFDTSSAAFVTCRSFLSRSRNTCSSALNFSSSALTFLQASAYK